MSSRAGKMPELISVQTTDFDVMAQGLPGWQVEAIQMGHGPFDGRMDLANFFGFTFCQLTMNREVLVRGNHRPGTFGFGFPRIQAQPTSVSGRAMKSGQVISLGPDVMLDQVTNSNYHSIFVEIEQDVFLKNCAILTRQELNHHLSPIILTPPAALSQRVSLAIQRIIHFVLLPSHASHSELVLRRKTDALMAKLCQMILQAKDTSDIPLRIRNRQAIFRAAEEFMNYHPDGSLSMMDLCKLLEVSERSVHYSFQETVGLSPMAYYRKKRLNMVRRHLKEIDRDTVHIANVARRFGFWHTGQFAIDYFRIFGELPSTTTDRPARTSSS